MISNLKLQLTYNQLKNPFPYWSPLWHKRDREIQRFAELVTLKELGLTEETLQLYSNGLTR